MKRWWPGAAAGVCAGLVLVGVMLNLRLLTGVPSLLELGQEQIVQALPGEVSSGVIERLRALAKPFGLSGMIALLLAAGAVAGTIYQSQYRRLHDGAEKDRLRSPMVTGLLLGFAWWAAIAFLLLPALGLGVLAARAYDGAETLWWSLPAFVAFGLTLPLFLRRFTPVAARTDGASYSGERRRAVALLAVGGAVTLAGGGLWRVLERLGGLAVVRGRPDDGTLSSELTPPDRFYTVSKNAVDPTVEVNGWSLEVRGLVKTPLRLSYTDIVTMPSEELTGTLSCISNGVGGPYIGTTRWTGVPLAALLERAGVRDEAAWVLFEAADGYSEYLPLARVRQEPTLLVYLMDGEPLTHKHGYPLRLYTTGHYGVKNPKWITKIEVAAERKRAYWEQTGWEVNTPVQTMARFDTRPEQLPAGQPFTFGGVAFAGDRGISLVDVSVDGGTTWQPADLRPRLSPYAWVLWTYTWTPMSPGDYRLQVRATDGGSAPQESRRRDPFPSGATGYHTIRVSSK